MRFFLIAAVAVSLAAAGPTAADTTQLVGNVGPGYTISLKDAGGATVSHLAAGTYTIVVHDQSDIHNFHLFGPGGVNVATDVDFVGDKTFTVSFGDGAYTIVCDAHPASMKGSFTVGSTPPTTTTTSTPPAPRPLTLALGPGRRISAPARLASGRYAVTVRDLSAVDDLHLKGTGVDRKTGIAFKGTAHWTLTLKRGTYRAFSDAHRSLVRTVIVS
jgi:plastocyanin